jgi:hypothetical protein
MALLVGQIQPAVLPAAKQMFFEMVSGKKLGESSCDFN